MKDLDYKERIRVLSELEKTLKCLHLSHDDRLTAILEMHVDDIIKEVGKSTLYSESVEYNTPVNYQNI